MRRDASLASLLLVGALAGCSNGGVPDPESRAASVAVTRRVLTVEDAVRELHPSNEDVTYAPGTTRERAVLTDLVRALWLGDDALARRVAVDAGGVGLLLESWEVEGLPYWVVREPPSRRRGAGIYVVRAAPLGGRPLLLQAPHAYFDRGTGEIAARALFEDREQRIRGLFRNSLHRYQVVPGVRTRDPASPSDVAHNPDHLFNVATAATIATPGAVALVVQLHGFDDDADRGAAGGVGAIVSSSEERSSAASTAIAAALGGPAGGALRYPEEVQRLGGTRNVQGRICRAARVPFVHLELSPDRRAALIASREARDRLRAALDAGLVATEADRR